MSELTKIEGKTKNGMTTNVSSLNNCVNLFFSIGAMRGKKTEDIISVFMEAFEEDKQTAMRILFWSRDVREGAGERQIFRDIISHLVKVDINSVKNNLNLISEYGRWDDTHTFFGTELESDVVDLISNALKSGNSLAAKWSPRKGIIFNKIRKNLKVTPKELRKLLVSLSKTVEQKMCSKQWSEIEYPKTPSLAMSRYMKAFGKNDYERFTQYIQSLKSGETKINASAVYPYDIIKSLRFGDKDLSNEQWKALPNWLEGSSEYILPVVDVSGSMDCSAGGNKNLTCMDVAISLGMYISERNDGLFKDMFMTFSSNPTLQRLFGDLETRYRSLSRAEWGVSTDIYKTFKTILDQAVRLGAKKEEMPTMILILSDMEFNTATSTRYGTENNWGNPGVQDMIKEMYQDHGYDLPKIVYWNLNDSGSNFPVKHDERGTCLVSGFSPSIMKSLLSDFEEFTPYNVMDKTVNSKRYEPITI